MGSSASLFSTDPKGFQKNIPLIYSPWDGMDIWPRVKKKPLQPPVFVYCSFTNRFLLVYFRVPGVFAQPFLTLSWKHPIGQARQQAMAVEDRPLCGFGDATSRGTQEGRWQKVGSSWGTEVVNLYMFPYNK